MARRKSSIRGSFWLAVMDSAWSWFQMESLSLSVLVVEAMVLELEVVLAVVADSGSFSINDIAVSVQLSSSSSIFCVKQFFSFFIRLVIIVWFLSYIFKCFLSLWMMVMVL